MRIVCPSCEATYDVPDKVLAAATKAVRCGRCGTEWAPVLAAPPAAAPPIAARVAAPAPEPPAAIPEPDADIPPPPEPAPVPEFVPRAESRLAGKLAPANKRDLEPAIPPEVAAMGRSTGAAIGWVLSIVVLLSLGAAAVSWRGQVMAAWPPSERLFAAIGLL